MIRHTTLLVGVFGCAFALASGTVTLGQEKKAGADDLAAGHQLDRRLPEINFTGQELADVFDFLRDISGASIYVDWKSLEAAGIRRNTPVTIRLKDVTFDTALRTILQSVSTAKGKAEFTVGDGMIVVSTAEDPKHPRAKVSVTGLPEKLDRRLPEVNFNGQAFGDVIDFLRDVTGANIFVDWNAVRAAGIDKDTPVTARLRDVRFSVAIKRVLEEVSDRKTPVEATFKDNVLTITAEPTKPVDAEPKKPDNGGK